MRRIIRTVLSSALVALLTLGFLAPTSAEAASKKVSAGSVKISGTAKVGLTLTAKTASWKPAGVALKYQWYRSGKKIGGATKVTYTLGASDLNKTITVKVSGSKAGYKAASKTSGKTKKVGLGTITAGSPRISGDLSAGSVVKVQVGTWTPSGLSFTYQWLRAGVPISGATKASYTVAAADSGKVLTVKVTASKSGYAKASASSGPSAPVAKSYGAGMLRVGVDIPAGTYVSTTGGFCYWERRDSAGSSLDGIIANFVGGAERKIVTISPSDKYFMSRDCGYWKVLPTTGSPASSFGDGQHVVGLHIVPGVYRIEKVSSTGCYWETLSGFGGTLDEIIDNDFLTVGRYELEITAEMLGISSSGCGTWKLQ
jgi:hypothetical protein